MTEQLADMRRYEVMAEEGKFYIYDKRTDIMFPCTEQNRDAMKFHNFLRGYNFVLHRKGSFGFPNATMIYYEAEETPAEVMRKYIAVWHADRRIISVLATSKVDAIKQIVSQLNRPGRRDSLEAWERYGRKLIVESL